MQVREIKSELPVRKTSAAGSKGRENGGQVSFMDILKNTSGAAGTKSQKAKGSKKEDRPESDGGTAAAQQMAAAELQAKPEQKMAESSSAAGDSGDQTENTSVSSPEDGAGAAEAVLQEAMYHNAVAEEVSEAASAGNPVQGAAVPGMVPGGQNAAQASQVSPISQVPEGMQPADVAVVEQAMNKQQPETTQPDTSQPGSMVPENQGAAGQSQMISADAKDRINVSGMEETEDAGSKTADHYLLRAEASRADGQQAETENGGQEEAQADHGVKGMAEALKQSYRAAGQQTDEKESQVDLEKLQKEVDNKSYLDTGQMAFTRLTGVYRADSAQGLQETQVPVLRQVETGLQQALIKGQQSFSMRLQPEGLGEVIVHMASVGGKLAMSIGVTSQETQKLLSSEMAQLKEALQPFHAEIKEIYQSQNGGMDMMAYQQNFYQQQRQQLYERMHFSGRRESGTDAEIQEEAPQQAGRIPPEGAGSVLNAYV